METAAGNADQEEEEDEEECRYFYQPTVQPQMPIADRNIEHAYTQEDSDHETPVLSTDGPVVEERPLTNTNEPETQPENVLRQEDNQSEDVQPVEDSLDEIPITPRPDSGEVTEQGHDLPRRERRPPKIFTYDRLGTPACYSTVQANEMFYQYQPMPYREVQPVTM